METTPGVALTTGAIHNGQSRTRLQKSAETTPAVALARGGGGGLHGCSEDLDDAHPTRNQGSHLKRRSRPDGGVGREAGTVTVAGKGSGRGEGRDEKGSTRPLQDCHRAESLLPSAVHLEFYCLRQCTSNSIAFGSAPRILLPLAVHLEFYCLWQCTSNSIAFGSAPRREADSQPISQLARSAVSQTETHSSGVLSVADSPPSSGEERRPQGKQCPNGTAADRRLSGRRFEPPI